MDFQWQEPIPELLTAGIEDVHFWKADLPQAAGDLGYYKTIISPEESKRVCNLCIEERKNRYIITHGILNVITGIYLSVKPEEVVIRYNTNGVPFIDGISQSFFFNLSCSKELALYCFSSRWKSGIDIEHQSGVKDIFRFSRRYFTRKENELLLKAESQELLVLFYRIWTRKEACLKAPGWGLTKPLNYLDVDPAADSPFISMGGSGSGELTLAVSDIETESGYSASAATIITDRKPHYAGWIYTY